MTTSNALFTEAQTIKDFNSELQDIQETLALSLVDSLKDGDHITTPTVIDMLKDLEDLQIKYYDRLEENENLHGGLENQSEIGDDEEQDAVTQGWHKVQRELEQEGTQA